MQDIVSALEFCALTEGQTGVCNCGYGKSLSLNALIGKILAATNSDSVVHHGAERPGDIKHSLASVEKLHQAGWVPDHGLDAGLQATLKSMTIRT